MRVKLIDAGNKVGLEECIGKNFFANAISGVFSINVQELIDKGYTNPFNLSGTDLSTFRKEMLSFETVEIRSTTASNTFSVPFGQDTYERGSITKSNEFAYTLENLEHTPYMLPPVGSKAILCVVKNAACDASLKQLDGEEILIVAHNESKLATWIILSDSGRVLDSSVSNFAWFKPLPVYNPDEDTLEELMKITGSQLTKRATASYLLEHIKNGDIPNVYYKENK